MFRIFKHLYARVLLGLVLGIICGFIFPQLGIKAKFFADLFIHLIKMLITPIIFCTVSLGIAKMESMKEVGRVGVKTLFYFEVVSTIALLIGVVVALVFEPGSGMNIDPATLSNAATQKYTEMSSHSAPDVLTLILSFIPKSVIGAFAEGNLIQVLLFSVLFGIALSHLGSKTKPVVEGIELVSSALMKIIDYIMEIAPFAAFGAMAFTVGKYGATSLTNFLWLILCLYTTSILFITVVLGSLCRYTGIGLLPLLRYIKDELLIVLGTSTTESVLPRIMVKMEKLGCPKSIVGLVLPTGYSFNLDGAAIYLSMTVMFLAQAMNVHVSTEALIGLIIVMLFTSKGGAGVAGAALVVLTATLSAHPLIPVAGVTLVMGIDRILNEVRALTNLIGNVIATLVIAKWEKQLNVEMAKRELTDSN